MISDFKFIQNDAKNGLTQSQITVWREFLEGWSKHHAHWQALKKRHRTSGAGAKAREERKVHALLKAGSAKAAELLDLKELQIEAVMEDA